MALQNLFSTMCRIRAFETEVASLYRDGEIPGFVHTSLGQEAVAAGVCAALREDDYLATTHRGHGHVLAKGADLDGMMAELFGRADGLCGGRGGSMHIADPSRGILGANAIVGASMPLATGAGLASKQLGQDRVAVAFFGEGAVNQGTFHEALNLCAIWNLPVLFACENNIYAEFSDSRTLTRVASVAERASSYGVKGEVVHGNDVEAVEAVTAEAVARCRAGEGPALVEYETYRWHGHYEGDAQPYKPDDEVAAWRERDPLEIAAARLLEAGTTAAEIERIKAEEAARVSAAVERARAAAEPDPEEVYAHVYGD
jgi:acetoin:2,6-dichlorophenolindophenol oxidoreductase subunit alpha